MTGIMYWAYTDLRLVIPLRLSEDWLACGKGRTDACTGPACIATTVYESLSNRGNSRAHSRALKGMLLIVNEFDRQPPPPAV